MFFELSATHFLYLALWRLDFVSMFLVFQSTSHSLLVDCVNHQTRWEIQIHDDDDIDNELEFLNKFVILQNELVDKEMVIDELETLNQILIVKSEIWIMSCIKLKKHWIF